MKTHSALPSRGETYPKCGNGSISITNENICTRLATVTAPHSVPGCPRNRGESELSIRLFKSCVYYVYMFLITNTLQAEFLAKTHPCF